MSSTRISVHVPENERGFTLLEVLVTVVIMGIVFSIATVSWQNITEARRVTAATNQFAADLRLAHSSAINQLRDYAVGTKPPGPGAPTSLTSLVTGIGSLPTDADYYIVRMPPSGLASPSDVTPKYLPGGTQTDTQDSVRFKPDGSAELVTGTTTIVVGSEDGDVSSGPSHSVGYVTATSRIRID